MISSGQRQAMTTKETVLQRLINLRLALDVVDAERWLLKEKIPSLGNKTAAQLILNGHADILLEEIERVAKGGYS